MTITDFAYYGTAFVESLMFFLLFDTFFEKRKSFAAWQYVVGFLVLSGMIMVVNANFSYKIANAIGMILSALIVSCFYYRTSWKKRAFVPLLTWVISASIEIVVMNMISLVFHLTTTESLNIPVFFILGIVLSKAMNLAAAYAIRVKIKNKDLEFIDTYWVLFIVLFTFSVIAVALIFWMLYELDNEIYNAMATVCSIGLFASNFFVLYFYERMNRLNQVVQNQTQAEQQMTSQIKHMDEIILKQKEVRKIRHDMDNQLIALKSYLDKGDVDGGQHYLENISQQLQSKVSAIDTGNTALDAILSTKKALAESKGISFTMQLHIQEKLPIDPADVCIIFGNALDNAIEACERAKNLSPTIHLVLQEKKNTLFCKLVNTAPVSDTLNLTTSKKDRHNHGYGIQNMKEALSHYDSLPVFRQEGATFTLLFQLFLDEGDTVSASQS